MKKTVVLCFIHGFKGGESTFGDEHRFTQHLQAAVAHKLPKAQVQVLVYPKYETRGDLGQCVRRFRSWLEDKVIDMEVAAGTPSPTVDGSVRTVLVGHSMGGIVAAEAAIGLASDKPVGSGQGGFNGLMFPFIQGVLAFDTPYLGIAPGVVAHGAESQYKSASAALSQLSGLGAAVWGDGSSSASGASRAALPAAPRASQDASQAAASDEPSNKPSASPWASWGKLAVAAGAAGAVAAAWANRERLATGWNWASSHLEFVGCLARAQELKERLVCMSRLSDELDMGFANFYTMLGPAAAQRQATVSGTVLGPQRTFCNLPKAATAPAWRPAVNHAASDEPSAHMNMFDAGKNPAYQELVQDAAALVAQWLQNDWYQSSSTT
ncbi:hypothetical protein CDD81_6376 [Ophiocordyceps australis]|uniref:DUF676 domain-containing protein n=1 Tax=Ophiocordyceps australis TaxID=1399860 RepID=A0A2C5Y0M9_9HYPO|nr:hypothetical protein CDD81_6376 [Ophiocordyceps australis]